MDRPAGFKWIRSPRDYWKIGPLYIWKWLTLFLLAAGAGAVLGIFGLPSLRAPVSGPEIPQYAYNDPALLEVTGAVRILDGQGRVRYEGEVAAGSCTGQGKIYDQAGQLVYDGPLVDGVRAGEDGKVYSGGVLVYEGAMAADRYEGEGQRVDPDTGVVSQGQFVAGVFEGEGSQYAEDGTLLRTGTFVEERLNGQGREYSEAGVLLREGTFRDGLLHGEGTQYTAGGALEYQGEFYEGTFHGQGALYDTLSQTLRYQGEFVHGRPAGQGRLYHPSGQLLYEGQVADGQPRADAFLGLSLAEVEAAFQEHWLLYAWEGVTAFVYPSFHLMFITEMPVELVSPSGQAARTEEERQQMLEAIAARTEQEAQEEAEVSPQPSASAQPAGDVELSPDTEKAELTITQVLSYGAPLAGVAQPESLLASGTQETGWQGWFSDFAAGETLTGASVAQTGPFVYEFTAEDRSGSTGYYLAEGAGVASTTVYQDGKDGPLWYQSAERKEDGT